jgi:cell wall-associated NlpC family hydrolase
MTEDQGRTAVVAEARSWIGTPYRVLQGVKGLGVDCVMLLVRCFRDSGVIPDLPDPEAYSPTFMLHRDEENYLAGVLGYAGEVVGPPDRMPLPGDVVLWRVGRTMSHGGIVSVWPYVIHAYQREQQVTESNVDLPSELSDQARHPRRFFNHWATLKNTGELGGRTMRSRAATP